MGSKINLSRFYDAAKSQLYLWTPTFHLSEDERVEKANDDKTKLIFSVFFQLVVIVGSGFLWWYLGGSIRPMIGGVCAGVVLGAFIDWISFACLTNQKQVQRFGWFWHVNWLGYVALILVTSALTGLLGRVWTGAIIVVQILIWLIGMLVHWRGVKRNPDFLTQPSSETIKWFGVFCGVVFVPFLVAWSVASVPWWNSNLSANTVRAWLDKERSERPGRLNTRIDPNRCRWTHNGQPIRVAVTLSGGGYRAAIIHAGLLAALDAQCVPIHILSTVSGGSIIGAAYDAGVPPSTFASKLASQVPGLPTDVMNMFSVLAHLAINWGTITETYRDHFARTFFGELLLGELPDAPLLLVNATDLEAGAQEAREIFFKNRAPAAKVDGKPLDRFLSVAEVVAASGAFPGAFLPAALYWVEAGIPANEAVIVKKRQFTDGGVAENLGVEGLRRYLTLPGQDGKRPPRVHVLIISDASAYGGPDNLAPRADAMTLLKRATGYTYDLLHRHLYARYTGHGNFFEWVRTQPVAQQVGSVQYEQIDDRLKDGEAEGKRAEQRRDGGPQELLSVAIPATASVMKDILGRYNCKLGNDAAEEVQKRVARLETLYELNARQVKEAFWLGYTVGQIYRPAIECAHQKAMGASCSSQDLGATQPSCPSLESILRADD